MGNGKKKTAKKLADFFTKKVFSIELDDALVYPSSKIVIEKLEKYANKTGETLEFISQGKPVTFYLDKVLYGTKIGMSRGGYFIHCKEV